MAERGITGKLNADRRIAEGSVLFVLFGREGLQPRRAQWYTA